MRGLSIKYSKIIGVTLFTVHMFVLAKSTLVTGWYLSLQVIADTLLFSLFFFSFSFY